MHCFKIFFNRFNLIRYVTVSQARRVMSAFGGVPGPERLAAAVAMHARLTDPDDIHALFDSPREYWRLRESLGVHAHFRAVNPTGRYALNLAVTVDRTVAHRLMDAAVIESVAAVGGGGGSGKPCWRNVRVNGRNWTATSHSSSSSSSSIGGAGGGGAHHPALQHNASSSTSPALVVDAKTGIPQPWLLSDRIPNHGTLEFDYASNIEPPPALAAGIEHMRVDLGLERDRARRFALWTLLYMLDAAPDLDVAFKDPADRDAARTLMELSERLTPDDN